MVISYQTRRSMEPKRCGSDNDTDYVYGLYVHSKACCDSFWQPELCSIAASFHQFDRALLLRVPPFIEKEREKGNPRCPLPKFVMTVLSFAPRTVLRTKKKANVDSSWLLRFFFK